MKIALGQMHIRWEDKAANLARVESWAELLKEKNIDLFVLPEMSLTRVFHAYGTDKRDR